MLHWKENQIFKGANGKNSLYDVVYDKTSESVPIIIFAHGYKGFKDWGAWNLVAEAFARSGFVFVKFNFSHNGGTIEEPLNFPDLDAFAENRYSFEIEDISRLIDTLKNDKPVPLHVADYEKIGLIGHSRGGGIAICYTAADDRIRSLSTWAAVSDFSNRFPAESEIWKEQGQAFVRNSRTGQMMPHNFSFFEDFVEHREELDVIKCASNLKVPLLIVHGTEDESVSPEAASKLKLAFPQAQKVDIEGAGHTFGAAHPWKKDRLPASLEDVASETIEFFSNTL